MKTLISIVCFASAAWAQVLLLDGDGAFVVRPGALVDLRVVLSSASIGGNVAGASIRFIAPTGRGGFAGASEARVTTDAAGKASATFTAPNTPGYFSVDAVAAIGDGAVVSFAFSVGTFQPAGVASTVKADLRRLLLRNAADGSNLQLVGPYWLEPNTQIRPARWSKDKEAGGLWRADTGSWFFWLDDGPARSWAKPTRYYLVPGSDVAAARISGEQWWPLLRSPNGDWQSVGRATSFAGALIPTPLAPNGTGDTCGILMANAGQAGAAVSFAAFDAYLRRQAINRIYNDPALANGCRKSYVLISAAGDRDGVWLDRCLSWDDLAARLSGLGELTVVIESNQSGNAAKWWNGRGWTGAVISSTDDLRIGYMQPLLGGFVARGLIAALDRPNATWESAVAETLRGDLVVGSARPQFQRLDPSGPRKLLLDNVEFSNIGGWRWVPFVQPLSNPAVNVSDATVAQAFVMGNGVMVRGLTEGRADLLVTATLGGVVYNGLSTIRVGLGASTVKTCLIVAGQAQCQGQFQRTIPVAEDEVGGHAFLEIQDESIASLDSRIYTYNRGERNIPVAVRGVKAGRTWLKVRSHDGNVMGDIPIQVAEAPAVIQGTVPVACPDAATYRASFEVVGGDRSLFEPFGGAWWGTGITLVFRKTTAGRFEIRSSGATEGQFFAISGTLAADCSFVGTGQGIAGLRITTAQVRGRIIQRAGVFDSMTLDYSIGVDGVFGQPLDYRGTAALVSGCGYQVTPAEAITARGGLFAVRIGSPALCPWTAAVASGAAEVVVGQIGFGPGVLWLQVPENSGAVRAIQLDVAGQRVELTQTGATPGAPRIQTLLQAGRLDTIVTAGSLAFVFGANLERPISIANLPAATLFYNPSYMVIQTPTPLRSGVAEVSSGALVLIERSAPGVLEGNFVTGIDLSLPVLIEIDGVEQSVLLRPAGAGLYQMGFSIELGNVAGKSIVVRQGGRASQRGAFAM